MANTSSPEHEQSTDSSKSRRTDDEFPQVMKRRRIFSLIVLVILIAVVVGFSVLTIQKLQEQWQKGEGVLRITMLNIGQGDAILIQTPEGNDVLIDSGPNDRILNEIGHVLAPWNRTIETVIATHDDADHIGGMHALARRYTINQWVVSDETKTTPVSEDFRKLLTEHATAAQVIMPNAGDTIILSESVQFEVLWPVVSDEFEDSNDASVSGIVRYKDFSLLLTGDVSAEVEREWMNRCGSPCPQLDVDALKVGHHGSRTSTSQELLHLTTPDVAFIPVGVDNRYGHPHPSIIDRLQKAVGQIWRTDQHGRVQCETTGEDLLICEPQYY